MKNPKIKFTYSYKKIVKYSGFIMLDADEFTDAREIAAYCPEHPECGECQDENDWSELESCSAHCDMCAKEAASAPDLVLVDEGQYCKSCFEENEKDEKQEQ